MKEIVDVFGKFKVLTVRIRLWKNSPAALSAEWTTGLPDPGRTWRWEEAMVDPVNETIWASQKAIAALFDCTKQNVSYHMGKIFASGELERSTVVKEILTTAQSGARGLSEDKVLYYNLDAIISVGYRINSLRATKFRIWSTSILKEYMRRGYVINRNAISEL